MNIDVMGAEDRLSKAWQTLSGLITETAHHTASLRVLIKPDLCMFFCCLDLCL